MVAAAALWQAGCAARPAALRIAAAADLRFALEAVVKAYGGERIERSYGSSGMFYAELLNHAPFDIFLSADARYPRQLAEHGLILPGSEFTYATGRIVLWTAAGSGIDVERLGMEALRAPGVRHVAIANPAHAPYGRAAEAALDSLGVYEAVRGKLVMGEDVGQAMQLTQSGAAEVGIVALSLAIAPGAAGGRYWQVPAAAYPRLEQAGAILKWTRRAEAARGFRAFLLGPEGRAILQRYGFAEE